MSYNYLPLDATPTSLQQLGFLLEYDQQVSVTFTAYEAIEKCRKYLDEKMREPNKTYYGVNTGFGFLHNVKIEEGQVEELQYNLLMSHACGVGSEVPQPIIKLMLALKIKSLGYGRSGVQNETVQRLIELHNNNTFPVIYTQGSLGASGDLSPLSHLALPIIGMGEVWVNGVKTSASVLEEKFGWTPVQLKSKEGLALINGTQFMSAYGIYCLLETQKLFAWAQAIAALSAVAFHVNTEPFDELIQSIRPHAGQAEAAKQMRSYLQNLNLPEASRSLQDPYSFRCIPQVHGASLDVWQHVHDIFITEVNSVTDNPNVFPDEDAILSGGNFHGQPLAMALDYLAIAMSEMANISERRTYQLLSGQKGMPLFLIHEPGLQSGFMIPQYTAASLVSENKQLCSPASVDSISSSNNQEDHVSMGANAAVKCYRVLQNLRHVLAIELLSAAQAIDLQNMSLKGAPELQRIHTGFRRKVSFAKSDRVLHYDMIAASAFLENKLEKIIRDATK